MAHRGSTCYYHAVQTSCRPVAITVNIDSMYPLTVVTPNLKRPQRDCACPYISELGDCTRSTFSVASNDARQNDIGTFELHVCPSLQAVTCLRFRSHSHKCDEDLLYSLSALEHMFSRYMDSLSEIMGHVGVPLAPHGEFLKEPSALRTCVYLGPIPNAVRRWYPYLY